MTYFKDTLHINALLYWFVIKTINLIVFFHGILQSIEYKNQAKTTLKL